MSTGNSSSRLSRAFVAIGVAGLCLGLVAVLAITFLGRSGKNTITVDFERTVSLYEGSKVRILGVDVGTVDKITPRGQNVRVTISWNADYDVPADAKALIVSPSVVGDRFVQLAPAFTGGEKLKDGAHLDQSRTGTPTELDETFAALSNVSTKLGPEGLNEDGSLSALLANSADNLEGKGAEIRESIAALAKLSKVADTNKDEFFTSVEQIERFVTALETNDSHVREFNSSLAAVSDVLGDEADDLQLALKELASAMTQIRTFVADNREGLRKNISGLSDVTDNLAKQRKNLAQILQQGPKALSNLAKTYNPTTGAIDGRASIKGSKDGAFSIVTEPSYVSGYCALASAQNPEYTQTCYAVGDLAKVLAERASDAGGASASSATDVPAPEASTEETLAYMMGVA